MLTYTEKDVKEILSDILHLEDFIILPIGNHHIARHLVYRVDIDGISRYIFKIYYIKRKRIREIESLKLLKNSSVRVPEIIDYGEIHGDEWILLEFISGEIFENVYVNLNLPDKHQLFKDMGDKIGLIHSYLDFDFIGDWDEKMHPHSYSDIIIKRIEKRIESIQNQDLPDKKLLEDGIKVLRDNYRVLSSIKESRLMHNDFDGRNILVNNDHGQYRITAVIDFEQCYPENHEMDLANLYLKYFYFNKDYEKAFLEGYTKHLEINSGFYDRLQVYLIYLVLEHCSWSFKKANDFYTDNINFLELLLKRNIS